MKNPQLYGKARKRSRIVAVKTELLRQLPLAEHDLSRPNESARLAAVESNMFFCPRLHLSRIHIARQVDNRRAEAGNAYLIVYYDVECEAKSGSYPASLMTSLCSIATKKTHYGKVLDALSDQSIDANL